MLVIVWLERVLRECVLLLETDLCKSLSFFLLFIETKLTVYHISPQPVSLSNPLDNFDIKVGLVYEEILSQYDLAISPVHHLLVCMECESCVYPKHLQSHLQKTHTLTLKHMDEITAVC